VTGVSRRLRDLAEPIAANVYFAPEAQEAYAALGLDYPTGYFCSRGACMGQVPGEVVAAAFGVFNPEVVIPLVEAGWKKTDAATILDARHRGAIAALHRQLGNADTSRAVAILRPVMEGSDYAGRMLFSGLRSLPFPGDPLGALWRVCDLVREHRGDGHIAAWVGAGCDPVEIGLLTELYWGLQPGTYIRSRAWSKEQIDAALDRLQDKGLVRDGAFTDEGRAFRRDIERATDAMEQSVVRPLGDRADELLSILEPWTKAIIDQGGYPVDPSRIMSQPDD
jgi:hypothetical protein